MINKLKRIWFLLTTILVLSQTFLTFLFLYRQAKEYKVLPKVVMVLALIYIVAFIVLMLMSLHAKKYSKEALSGYKRSQKAIKRFLNLVILSLNILYVINMGGLVKLYPIVMLVFNVLLIIFDIKMAEIADKIERRKKKRQREKKERQELKEQKKKELDNSHESNYGTHKKRRFFGDFSKNAKQVITKMFNTNKEPNDNEE